MDAETSRKLYADLGVRPVINCSGYNLTVLGGSILSPAVMKAMEDANRYYADMRELLIKSGSVIAEAVGAEAALITTGCSSAMLLGVAALMAGTDRERAARLPDARGMRYQIIIQKGQRYKYDRALTLSGAQLVEVGSGTETRAADVAAAIGPDTLAIHFVAPGGREGLMSFEELLQIAREHHIPVLVDAAGQVWPLENLRRYPSLGADLAAYSSKYFGGPNSTGFLAGRKDLIEAAFLHSFVGFEYGPPWTMGRPMKLDRQEIFGVLAALREWVSMDHTARFAVYRQRAEKLRHALSGISHIQAALDGDPVSGVRVTYDAVVKKSTMEIGRELMGGNPSLWFHWDLGLYLQQQAPNSMVFSVREIMEGDERGIAERLRAVLEA